METKIKKEVVRIYKLIEDSIHKSPIGEEARVSNPMLDDVLKLYEEENKRN